MKTYEEVANNVITRSEAVLAQRKKKKRMLLRILSITLPCIAVVLIGAILINGYLSDNAGSDPFEPMSGKTSYGVVEYLSPKDKNSTTLVGQSTRSSTGGSGSSSGVSGAPPSFEFSLQQFQVQVVCRAVEECTGVYEELPAYGYTGTPRYRIFKMETIDPLESNICDTFYYMLPIRLEGDLTQYDALLISMQQSAKNLIMRCDDQLVIFENAFFDSYPELGNIIAFNDNVFDETLWQDESWIYGYQFAKGMLDSNHEWLLVHRGMSLERTLQRLREQRANSSEKVGEMNRYVFQSEEAKEAMEYLTPFQNGVFIPQKSILWKHDARRYINGCPTNEYVSIDLATQTVQYSSVRFEDADYEGLPNISAYIAGLNLSEIEPQHTNTLGKSLSAQSAKGWYEKTENGVYAIVEISWTYSRVDSDMNYYKHYDETFILLDETGDHLISREALIELIGENVNIYSGQYGVGVLQPQA